MDQFEKLLPSLLNLHHSDVASFHHSTDDSGHLSIFVTLNRRLSSCPYCASNKILSNGFYKRKIVVSHRLFSDIDVFLKVPRYKCFNHHSFSDSFSMAPANSKVSYDSIITVMKLLLDPKMTFISVANLTHLSKSTVIRIFDHHCVIPRIPFPETICIDEVYTKLNSYDSKYSCIFYDFFNKSIIDVLPSRKKNYLHHYFQPLQGSKELLNVKFVCIDMYPPYRDIAKIYFKKAIICIDSFHVIKNLNDSLHKVRIRIMKSFDTDSINYYLLKRFKFLLFDRSLDLDNQARFNKRLNRYINYRGLLELILAIHPDLDKAYHLKEDYTIFNASSSFEQATQRFDQLYNKFVQAAVPEYSDFIGSLANWRVEIINSFLTYRGKRINSSIAESMNATISTLLFNTRGIRNSERRRKRIIYAINHTGFSLK